MPPGAQAEAVTIQGDGKIVAAGRTGGDVALARYLPGGALDPTFGDVGRVITSLGGDESASGIALQGDETLPDDGRIVIAGKTSTGDGRFLLACYHAGDFDTTPPDTGIISSPADPTNDPEPSFGLGSSEPGSSFERELDGAGFEPRSSPHALGPLPDGEHNLRSRATDEAGNADPTPASRSFTVDTSPPTDGSPSGGSPSGVMSTLVVFGCSPEAAPTPRRTRSQGPSPHSDPRGLDVEDLLVYFVGRDPRSCAEARPVDDLRESAGTAPAARQPR